MEINRLPLLKAWSCKGFRAVLVAILLCVATSASAAEFVVRDSVLIIPADVTEIPRDAFAWRTDFNMVDFKGEKLKKIGANAFAYCSKLIFINVPEGVTHIGSNAFSFCTSMTTAILPDSVIELGSYAFAECQSLERVTLPANKHMLGEYLFVGCRNLKEIEELSSIPPTFDCNSPLFDAEEDYMYRRIRLTLPAQSRSAYTAAPVWKRFFFNDK